MKKLPYLIILILLSINLLGQNNFRSAFNDVIEINRNTSEIKFLHFKIKAVPEYYENANLLTDLYYSIKYKEFGTPEEDSWVQLYDGHLINDPSGFYSKEWKGPYLGNRDISYKFLFQLTKELNDSYRLDINVFSTNPIIDSKYCNVSYSPPFIVDSYYYDTKNVKTIIEVFSGISTVRTIYTVIKSSNFVSAAISTAVEEILKFAINRYLDSLPTYIHLKCNLCGHERIITTNNSTRKITYTCETLGCHNRTEILLF